MGESIFISHPILAADFHQYRDAKLEHRILAVPKKISLFFPLGIVFNKKVISETVKMPSDISDSVSRGLIYFETFDKCSILFKFKKDVPPWRD